MLRGLRVPSLQTHINVNSTGKLKSYYTSVILCLKNTLMEKMSRLVYLFKSNRYIFYKREEKLLVFIGRIRLIFNYVLLGTKIIEKIWTFTKQFKNITCNVPYKKFFYFEKKNYQNRITLRKMWVSSVMFWANKQVTHREAHLKNKLIVC